MAGVIRFDHVSENRRSLEAWHNAAMSETIPAPIQAAFERERQQALLDARAAKEVVGIRALAVKMYGRLAELQQQVIADEHVAFACMQGCSYCCHLRVELRPHEAFVLAQHIHSRFNDQERAEVMSRLAENLERITPLTREQHIGAGIACALLVDGNCSAYEARPAACRKYYSLSVDTCRAAFNDTSAPLTGQLEHDNVRFAGNAVTLGFAKGMEDAGYNIDMFELHRALKLALESNKPEKRYRAGKKPFI